MNPFERILPKQGGEIKEDPRNSVLKKMTQAAMRSKIFRAFLLSTGIASLEGCAGGLKFEEGDLRAVHAETRPQTSLYRHLPSNQVMLHNLNDAYGKDVVAADIHMQQQIAKRAHEFEGQSMDIQGFEALDVDLKLVKQFFQETIPEAWWAHGHLKTFKVNPHYVPMGYKGFEGQVEYGHCEIPGDGNQVTIEFTSEKLNKKETEMHSYVLYQLFDTALHELAHGADFVSAPNLNSEQVLTLMYLNLMAVNEEGRPKFNYPEEVMPIDASQQKNQLHIKRIEFFAELMREALKFQYGDDWESWGEEFMNRLQTRYHASHEGAVHSVNLIRTHLEMTAPGFKPWDAAKKREILLSEMHDQVQYIQFGRMLEKQMLQRELSKKLLGILHDTTMNEDDMYYQIKRISGLDVSPDLRYVLVSIDRVDTENIKILHMKALLNSIVQDALFSRANRMHVRNAYGNSFHLHSGNGTIEAFDTLFKKLTPEEKKECMEIANHMIQTAQTKAPTHSTK